MIQTRFQDIIASLANTSRAANELLKGLSHEALRARNSPDEFSALENICHLRDIEIEGYEKRIDRILEGNNPTLPDIDGRRLAVARDYNSQELEAALKDFADARQRNIQTLMNLSSEQLDLTGTLEGVGTITIGRLVELMHEHDESHLHDLNIILRRHRGAAAI